MLNYKHDPNRVPSIEQRFWDRKLVSSYIRAVAIDVGHYAWRELEELLTVTEVYRTPEENEAVGGVKDSQHVIRLRADLYRPGKTTKEYEKDCEIDLKWDKCYAVDFRSNDVAYMNIEKLKQYVRDMWEEPLKAFMLYEPRAKKGAHLHLHVRREEWV